MEIKTELRDSVTIISVIGYLDSTTSREAEEKIMQHVGNECRIVIDMSKCEYISSAGLQVIIVISKQLQSNGGKWAFAEMQDEVAYVINITGFSGFLHIFSSIDDAIKSLKDKSDTTCNMQIVKGQISFEAKLENLESMLELITGLTRKLGFNTYKISKIRLAVEEILSNIIKYAYSDKSGIIKIFCRQLQNSALLIEIRDNGRPFNPLEEPPPDIIKPVNERAPGGLGIFLAKKIMDELKYERKESENILTMVKYAQKNT